MPNHAGATALVPIADILHSTIPSPAPQHLQQVALNPLAVSYCHPDPMSTPVPPHFYQVAAERPARFSTKDGKRPKRELVEPKPMPIIRTAMEADVEARANQLMKKFPQIASSIIAPPATWYNLHDFFDGYDLWVDGPHFCYFVAIRIARKNLESQRHIEILLTEIRKFAQEWVTRNQHIILRSADIGDLTTLFDEWDRPNLDGMSPDEVQYLVEHLDIERRLFLDRYAAAQVQSRIAGTMQPFPAFGGPQIVVAGPYPIHQFHQGPINLTSMAPTMPMADRHRHDSTVSNGARSVMDQRGPHGSFSNQPYRQFNGYSGIGTSRQSNGKQHIPQVPFGNDGFRQQGLSNSSGDGQARTSNRSSISHNNTRRCIEKKLIGSPPENNSMREPLYVHLATPHRPIPSKLANRVASAPMPYIPFHIQTNNDHSSSPPSGRPNYFNQTSSSSPGRNYEQNVQRSLSSSTALRSTRVLPSFSTSFQGPSNDARVLGTARQRILEPKLVLNSHNHSMTMWYMHKTETDNRNARTVHVNRINDDMFHNHVLKAELERYGEVENIHFLPSGSCFVLFTEPISAANAIRDCNGRNIFGYTLRVSEPIGAARARSGSNASRASQSYHNGGFHSSRRDYEVHPSRTSNRTAVTNTFDLAGTRNTSAGTHMIGSSPNRRDRGLGKKQLESHLYASLTEMSQHSDALTRYGQQSSMPLDNIANESNKKKRGKQTCDTKTYMNPAVNQAGSIVKKENSAPGKSATHSSGLKHTKTNKKGSKQNTSVNPTPTTSPMRQLSAANVKELAAIGLSPDTQEVEKPLVITVNNSQTSTNKFNKIVGKGIGCSESESSSNTDVTSETAPSPTESAPSSLSNISGRTLTLAIDKASMKRSQSAVDLTGHASGHASGHHVVKKSKGSKSKKSRGQKNEVKNSDGSADLDVQPSIPENIQAPKSQKPKKLDTSAISHSKKSSNTSTASKGSKRRADTPSGKSHLAERKPNSASRSINQTSPSAKPELTLSVEAVSADQPIKTEAQSPSLNDHEWPSLEPAKYPFLVADSKLPPPIMGALIVGSKDLKKKPAVPTVAVPRAFETRPQP
ncbi:hypothetical protein JHW43_004274 [Diplocarpon mali]|nr:hypothetical protein JHW43_004274 [Diplocarpon mali]